MKTKIMRIISLLKEINALPKVTIAFCKSTSKSLENYKRTYSYFTKLHRLKLFRNKTLGVALIDLNDYEDFEAYYKKVNGKNSAAYYARKATRGGDVFDIIDRNDFIDDIYEINTSAKERQGKAMSESYLKKVDSYTDEENYQYFGVLNSDGKLLSYCNVGFYGEFAIVVTLLGHKNFLNDGVMYLMMLELNKLMFNKYREKGYKYIMYDTFFGASEGLKKFKEKLGYKPYKVKWLWEN